MMSNISLPLDALLCRDASCAIHSDSLECYYNQIIECLTAASNLSVPVVKSGVQKHWWTRELDKLKQDCMDICYLWKSMGCLRNGSVNAEKMDIINQFIVVSFGPQLHGSHVVMHYMT